MTRLLVDTSVLIKWFHRVGEHGVPAARALRAAHVAGDIQAYIIDLAIYEVGNVLVRALRWRAAEVADQLADLNTVIGPPLALAPAWWSTAARLAHDNSLSFYDACWAAVAIELQIPLVSADRRLVATGLAESPSAAARRLGLARG